MKKTQTKVFILIIILCAAFSGCDDILGPKSAVTYTVTFDANGASGTAPAEQTVNAGTVIKLPDKGGLTSTRNIFVGWSENASGTGTIYSVGSSITVTQNMIFYAQWVDGSTPQYTVTFNANGATGGAAPASQTAYNGINITIPGQGTLFYSGKTFGGWNTQSNGGGTNYTAGAAYTVTGNVTLYAKWQSEEQYTVTYHANGASGTAPKVQTVDPGTVITLPGMESMVYAGRTFEGWNTQANGSGINYLEGEAYAVKGNVTLYAKWNIEIKYTVTFYANGASGTAPAAQRVDPGTVITLPGMESMVYVGRTFEGWNTQSNGSGTSYVEGEAYTVNADISFYARWSEEPLPLQPPGGLNASAQGTSSIQISWNAVSGATGYRIYRSSSASGSYDFLNSASSSPYTDNGLSSGTTYYYKVSSVRDSEESVQSSYASATTQSSGGVLPYPPAMPTGLVVSSVSSGSISLSWNSVSTADSYNVYRSAIQTGTAAKINTSPVIGTSYTDNVPSGQSFFYIITGVNSSGESPRSAAAFGFATSHYAISNYANAQTLTITSNTKHYYRLAVTQGNSYTISWQDGNDNDIPGPEYSWSPRHIVTAYQNDGTQIFSRNSGGYTNPAVFTATATGYVTIEVHASGQDYNYRIYHY